MKFLIWTLVFVSVLEILGGLWMLVTRDYPERTPATFAINIVVSLVIVIWGLCVLLNPGDATTLPAPVPICRPASI
jgi:hypothetical protein